MSIYFNIPAYAVVNMVTKQTLAVEVGRDNARYKLQKFKTDHRFGDPSNLKIVKLQAEKVIR